MDLTYITQINSQLVINDKSRLCVYVADSGACDGLDCALCPLSGDTAAINKVNNRLKMFDMVVPKGEHDEG